MQATSISEPTDEVPRTSPRARGRDRPGSRLSQFAEAAFALLRGRRSVPANLTARQLADAGIEPGQAGRGRAADIDPVTIANLNAMR